MPTGQLLYGSRSSQSNSLPSSASDSSSQINSPYILDSSSAALRLKLVIEIKNEKYKEALCKLLGELETSTATTLINLSYEATKESIHYLVSATFPFKNQIKIPEKLIEGENGHHTDGTSLSRKRKANEIDDECECDIGIVAEKWYFMEWTLDSEGKPSFKLSKILSVRCGYEERHDGKNPWSYYLEAHKPLEASQSREQSREITRIRSLSNRAKNSNFMYHAFFCIYF
ncbi:hypothetical protein GLOIN_2v1785755 [Rhizophagus irregularis DAOM 181602=DAOM 197198]|uniref:Uncharacterized protein n=1 Tax=Rhizophagus irregularis (strain DAOM 181602 / DAOM 197198 / MUCL 43194) TaxID=747089 RepID=A0A2P4P9M2_RHIID|nr:hypothetical protein GLOIN_2v1785755 [Rhizophagus irregularis DAOM 181602=DAOM 197198]POG62088.1 hypothetical protein GLOIN_2v1785755 [Rhizophagus irregularis DAOM 181602=DAOM 197198]|eukprot:XP_025168954.1 hypothetical protein GLOIN_2v1785755 [Rhizophagus irregularis DAOM 181602=DAOM 197198]